MCQALTWYEYQTLLLSKTMQEWEARLPKNLLISEEMDPREDMEQKHQNLLPNMDNQL